MLDDLLNELIDVSNAMQRENISFLLGGGMGLFLRDVYHTTPRQPRYPHSVPSRSTKDLDIFLTAEVIADAERMNALRDIIAALGYSPLVNYFQFQKSVQVDASERTLRIDLLSPPPSAADRASVKIKRPRISPTASTDIHAYLTDEAIGIEHGRIEIRIPLSRENRPPNEVVIFIPSSYNYVILKLHAYADRARKAEAASNETDRFNEESLASHHALDIFRIVTDMSEEDWVTASEHRRVDYEMDYLREAATIQRTSFNAEFAPGILAFRESEVFREHRDEFDRYLPDVVQDLHDLFTLEP